MKVLPKLLAAAVLAALSSPALAEIELDVIGGSEVSFEGLLQADSTGTTTTSQPRRLAGIDRRRQRLRLRAARELIFKGKGPGSGTGWSATTPSANKFLDTNVSYKFTGFTSLTVGQYKQPNSLEELGSTKTQRLHLQGDDHQPAGRGAPRRRRRSTPAATTGRHRQRGSAAN